MSTYKNVIKGLELLASCEKHGQDAYGVDAEHDQIYAGPDISEVPEGELGAPLTEGRVAIGLTRRFDGPCPPLPAAAIPTLSKRLGRSIAETSTSARSPRGPASRPGRRAGSGFAASIRGIQQNMQGAAPRPSTRPWCFRDRMALFSRQMH
jgi:hypothetical protein